MNAKRATLALVAVLGVLLAGCGGPPPAPREEDRALQRAIEAPQDKARAVEEQLEADRVRKREAEDDQGG